MEIAVDFLRQHHSIHKIEKTTMVDEVWMIEVLVSAPKSKKFTVRVNAKTGYILGWQ